MDMVVYVYPEGEQPKPRKRWPKGTKKGPIVTVQVRETEPSPILASEATIAAFRRIRRTPSWWKRHVEDLLRHEAFVIRKGYTNLLEYVRDESARLDHERKENRQLHQKLRAAERKIASKNKARRNRRKLAEHRKAEDLLLRNA